MQKSPMQKSPMQTGVEILSLRSAVDDATRPRGACARSCRVGLAPAVALLIASWLAAPLAAAAQEGGIVGRVTDGTGGVLPGVTVEVSGAALPAGPLVAVTDGDGGYAFTALPAGSYSVTFTLPGFERAEREVEVTDGLPATADAALRLGGLFEEVTVSVTGTAIEAPAINMPHAVTVVSRETLEQHGGDATRRSLPQPERQPRGRRRAEQLVQLQPAVDAHRERGQRQPARPGRLADPGADQRPAARVGARAAHRRALRRREHDSGHRRGAARGPEGGRVGHLRVGRGRRRRQLRHA